jgi:hypothetical protein
MKPILNLSLLTLLFALTATPCFAMMSIEIVSKERAKALGMEIRSNPAGPKAVRVELEFERKGELKDFARVDLEMRDGEKWVSASLREEQSTPGHVVVSFAADRANLDKITLRVVIQPAPRDMTGYELRMKDFVRDR